MNMLKTYLSKALNKTEKSFKIAVLTMMILSSSISMAYASTPKLVTGTVALFQAITGWLLLIIPVGAGAFVGYHALQKSLTDDQAVISEKNKLMKNTIITAAVGMTADGLVVIILQFYK